MNIFLQTAGWPRAGTSKSMASFIIPQKTCQIEFGITLTMSISAQRICDKQLDMPAKSTSFHKCTFADWVNSVLDPHYSLPPSNEIQKLTLLWSPFQVNGTSTVTSQTAAGSFAKTISSTLDNLVGSMTVHTILVALANSNSFSWIYSQWYVEQAQSISGQLRSPATTHGALVLINLARHSMSCALHLMDTLLYSGRL